MDGAAGPGGHLRGRPVSRPRVVVPARFARSLTALRHEYPAVVATRPLVSAVLRAGGDPLVLVPLAPGGEADDAEVEARLAGADGVLLPGGADVSPRRYGEPGVAEQVYGVDDEQDAFDLAVARVALGRGLPLLAVCRGVQVVNVALGGTLVQHMAAPHQPRTHAVEVTPGTRLAEVLGGADGAGGGGGPGVGASGLGGSGVARAEVSCSHHQCLARLGDGLVVTAVADDGTIEAVERPDAPEWFLGLQWHPEDTAAGDPVQQAPFDALVAAARA